MALPSWAVKTAIPRVIDYLADESARSRRSICGGKKMHGLQRLKEAAEKAQCELSTVDGKTGHQPCRSLPRPERPEALKP